ncbi:MAG: PD-(D/E)XK nuclease family protein [Nitrospinae bacterium]|nr:PD-(D/E)XK nuclease family protein [Nitrospinota bacterium]
MNKLTFLLVHGKTSALRVRMSLAQNGGWLGVRVGVTHELIHMALDSFLFSPPDDLWMEKLQEAFYSVPKAFWLKSAEVAPQEALKHVARTLSVILEGLGPDNTFTPKPPVPLPDRVNRRWADLYKLWRNAECPFPSHLYAINMILNAPDSTSLREIDVIYDPKHGSLSPWDIALIKKLRRGKKQSVDTALRDLAEQTLCIAPIASSNLALGHLQRTIFDPDGEKRPKDDSVQILAVRDYQEEAELAAGIVQTTLKKHAKLRPSDFALLVPDDIDYSRALREVFALAGIPLAGLMPERGRRDIGRETLLHFLLTLKPPHPAMALGSFLISPLLPLDDAERHDLAQLAIDNRPYFLRKARGNTLLSHVVRLVSAPIESAKELLSALQALRSMISDNESLLEEREVFHQTANVIAEFLSTWNGRDIPWEEVMELTAPVSVEVSVDPEYSQEGVAIFYEGEEPWRLVKRLLILGFNKDRYPSTHPISPVFSDDEMALIENALRIDIERPSRRLENSRNLFRRQIAAASESLTFLFSKRGSDGSEIHPSQTLAYIARTFENIKKADDLTLELHHPEDRAKAQMVPVNNKRPKQAPRDIEIKNLSLGANLLSKKDGSIVSLSPSALDTLLVSPLAWLLGQLCATPRLWTVDGLDVITKGSLAHDVFEQLFPVGSSLPNEKTIIKRIPSLVANMARSRAPLLLTPEWRLELASLEREIGEAAKAWGKLLKNIGGVIEASEQSQEGAFLDSPIHGRVDCVVALPGGGRFVVDYKKSSSGARRERMVKGYDIQAHAYRLMLTGTRGKGRVGVMYFTMNDQIALTDTQGWLPSNLPGVEELAVDVSKNAVARLKDIMEDLRKGRINLNTSADRKRIPKETGIQPYALDASPLIARFSIYVEE